MTTRDHASWNEPFVSYFAKNEEGVASWREEQKNKMKALVDAGKIEVSVPLVHGNASTADALRLYGVQK